MSDRGDPKCHLCYGKGRSQGRGQTHPCICLEWRIDGLVDGVAKLSADLIREKAKSAELRAAVDAAMVMYAACPADPDTTLRYECAVDGFVDALAKAGLRMPASLPAALSVSNTGGSNGG